MGRVPADVAEWAAAIRAGHRTAVSRAVTLVESSRPADRETARRLVVLLDPYAGSAHRIGMTGPPGVGKSTLIDALGLRLTSGSHRVAVLAVDPSSTVSGGSILGDRTRMARLSADPRAYVRPSPSGGALGGVTEVTAEVMTVVAAAGYDVVIVETVGVGQSETALADLVDTFVVLAMAGAGDDLQAIKMGVLERADIVAVTKADGAGADAARATAREISAARRLAGSVHGRRPPPVVPCSARLGTGLAELWKRIEEHHAGADLPARRGAQRAAQLRAVARDSLWAETTADPGLAGIVAAAERDVRAGGLSVAAGAERIAAAFRSRLRPDGQRSRSTGPTGRPQ
ncbi:methylmalonyl Co-A mutase-associated GTPase MeaB [Solwaraspora sp. WMMD792]|uniref:methylmalonyl Co-A mutase-associated GTPase MeaB n=1 Tax=Micromonosporaceae TaxID=28056 RepID=UPI002415EF20|nr:methylmalonyl Co-A mutase-associated GTPase MeaB [Solwaraspora sp. WMMD792]MDG4770715.1 methylmalonyl Co-A mutase-associated GTPase MeaB [Solwaraspora sp. WMMD792]